MSAQEIIDDPSLVLDPITQNKASEPGYTDDELRHLHIGENDVQNLILKIYGTSRGLRSIRQSRTLKHPAEQRNARVDIGPAEYAQVRPIVLDATFEEPIDATPTFTIQIHDPDWDLLNTDTLNRVIDINPGNIPHRWYRLDSVQVQDDNITLTFSTRNAVYLSYHKKPYSISRNKVTRAQFILTMLHHVKKVKIKMYCPELTKKQPIAKTKPVSKKSTRGRSSGGLDPGKKYTINNGVGTEMAKPDQIRNMEDALNEADRQGASPQEMVGTIMAMMVESNCRTSATNGQFVGCFQQSAKYGWPATRDVTKDCRGFLLGPKGGQPRSGFLYIARHNKTRSLADCVQLTQGADPALNSANASYNFKLNKAQPDADKVVKSFTGGEGVDDTATGPPKPYKFHIGPPDGNKGENYLAALYRLAEEVNWRAYWVRDVLHYQSETNLFKSRARARIRRYEDGVESVSFSWDHGKRMQTMSLRVRMENWVCPVGTVVIFDEGGPARGRWLVTNIRKSLFDKLGDITLSKPITEKKEPAHEPGSMKTKSSTGGNIDGQPFDGTIDTSDGAAGIVDQLFSLCQATEDGIVHGEKIRTPIEHLPGGSISDHSEHNAARAAWDISTEGMADWLNGPPNKKLDHCMKAMADACGFDYTEGQPVECKDIYIGEFRVQFIWRTQGCAKGHMGHIHVGARWKKQNPALLSSQMPPKL